jgi:hypothetical protein
MVCTEERAEAIFRIQRKMKVNDWTIDGTNTGADTGADKAKAPQKRTRPGKVSSK